MPELPWYPRYPKDIMADHLVMRMDNRAYGVYNRLLDIAWHEEPAASLPIEDAILAAYAREPLQEWLEIKPLILPCFTLRNGRLWQKRMKSVHDEMSAKHRNRVNAGRLGGRPKANENQSFSKASLRASDSDSPKDINIEEEISVQPPRDIGVNPPFNRDGFDAAAKYLSMPDAARDACWAYYDSQGWCKSNGRRVTGDPRSILTSWRENPQRKAADAKRKGPNI